MISYSELWSIQEPILAMATILQTYMNFSGRIITWKNATADWWIKLQLIKWANRYEISAKFRELFQQIYGQKLFSVRRLLSSTTSSTIFLLFSYWLLLKLFLLYSNNIIIPIEGNPYYKFIGYTEDFISHSHPFPIIFLIFDSIGINLVPDYISLAETGWIINKACKKESNLLGLFFIDIMLTTTISMVSHILAYMYSAIFIYGSPLSLDDFLFAYTFVHHNEMLIGYAIGNWAFVASTFSTSLLWILFIFSVLSIALLKRLSSYAVAVLESKWVAELPIVLFVGLLCLFSWPILFFLKNI